MLEQQTVGDARVVTWSFPIPADSPTGTGTVIATCNRATITSQSRSAAASAASGSGFDAEDGVIRRDALQVGFGGTGADAFEERAYFPGSFLEVGA